MNAPDKKNDALSRVAELERENRKLRRENTHLKSAVVQEKLAATTSLNQYKASTFIQRERERYLALLLANSPSIILILNHTGRVEFCTEYFVAKAGYASAEGVLGHTLTDVIARFLNAATHEALLEQARTVNSTNAPATFDAEFRFDHSGQVEDFAGLLVPMKDQQQQSGGFMLMLHDVTALKRSREEALEASKAKSAFLSNMSHEIRTPMNAIIGMTSIGKREADVQRKNYAFEKIEIASTHLLGVINDILDISKIESGKMELSHVVFSFTQMIERVLSVISLKIHDKRQHFSVTIDPEIPESLFGDDQRLAQVIANVLSNATKFTPEEGCITFDAKLLSMQDDAGVIQVSVSDTGIGMSRQEQGKLFNIFQQAQAGTARRYGGSGLGLAISKRILELMGGEIWVESEKGRGSCFTFTVPLGIPKLSGTTADARSAGGEPKETGERNSDFSGKVILLADDVDINLEIVLALLEPTNIIIDTARNGREAVDAVAANPGRYDLILMDVQMPEVDGLQATRMIRALDVSRAAAVPIIAMTANVFREDIEQCIAAGMNGHLGKPIVMRDVVKILSQHLHGT